MSSTAVLDHLAMPMKASFGHARATRNVAESVILRLTDDGVDGVGECVARDYVTGETPQTVFAAISTLDLDAVLEAVRAPDFDEAVRAIDALELPQRLAQGPHLGLAAAACVEIALLDLVGRRFAKSIRAATTTLGLPDALTAGRGERHRLTRAMDTSRQPEAFVTKQLLRDFDVLKIKVGLGRDEDVARVRATRELAGPGVTIAVDANMAWSLDEACAIAELLRPFSIAWYEQPFAKGVLADCRAFRDRTGARVMLDESLCSPADAQAAIDEQACDLFNIRIAKCGGFLASLRLAILAHRHGLAYQLGTHPGAQAVLRAAEWQFAHSVAGFATVEAARSHVWFEHEVIRESLTVDYEAKRVIPLDGPGLAVTVIAERLDELTQRRARWCDRRWTIA